MASLPLRIVTTTDLPRPPPRFATTDSLRHPPRDFTETVRADAVNGAGAPFTSTVTPPLTLPGRCTPTRVAFARWPSRSFTLIRPRRSRAEALDGGRAFDSDRPSIFQLAGVLRPSWCSTVGRMSTIWPFFTFAPRPGPSPNRNEVSSSFVLPKWLIGEGSLSGRWPWSVVTRIVQVSNG